MKRAVTKTMLGVSVFALAATAWCRPAAATSLGIFGLDESFLDAGLTGFAFNVPNGVTGLSGWDLFDADGIDTPTKAGDLTGLSTNSFPNEWWQTALFIDCFQPCCPFPKNENGVPPIPEPATMLLVGVGLGLAGLKKKIAG